MNSISRANFFSGGCGNTRFTQNVTFRTDCTFSVKQIACSGKRDAMVRGGKPGHIIIIYPAFTGFPVAHTRFFHLSSSFFPGKTLPAFLFAILARDMLPSFCLMSASRSDALCRTRHGNAWIRCPPFMRRSTQPGSRRTGRAVPLFSVFLGGAVFLTFR